MIQRERRTRREEESKKKKISSLRVPLSATFLRQSSSLLLTLGLAVPPSHAGTAERYDPAWINDMNWAGGSTLGPAMTFGALAGKHAASQPVKSET